MRPKRTKPSSFVAFLLAIAAIAGLLTTFDRMTPGGLLPTPTSPPPPALRTPSPVVVEPNRRRSVVLVSLGGASADALTGWMADGDMPTLARLAEQGWMATALRSTDPPLPSLALTALATGATSPDAEPIWQAAARHHRTTALLFWPDADPAVPDQRADYTLACTPPATAARQQIVLLSPGKLWAGSPASFSSPYEGTLPLSSPAGTATWRVLAVDTLDDSLAACDTFFFSSASDGARTVDGDTRRLTVDEWGTVPVWGRAAPGLMLTVTSLRTLTGTATVSPTASVTPTVALTPTATITPTVSPAPLLELTLYYISDQPMTAQPVALGQEVIERFGFCPPLPDPRTVAQGRLSPAAFGELASLRARWAMRAAAYVYETYRPHLLLVRQEALSASEQALLLADSRQAGYSPPRAAEFVNHRRAVATAVDDGLDDLLAAVDLNYGAVMVASEHGMAPVHTEVNVAAALKPTWHWLAQLDGGLLSKDAPPCIYVEGAFLSVEIGQDETAESAVVSGAVFRALAALTDPQTGKPVLARVTHRGDARSWAAAWPYPGDILAQAAPGYTLTAAWGTKSVFSEAPIYGQTGFDAHLQTMQGTFIAAGRGVSAGGERGIVRLPDIASMLATFLGMPPLTDNH